MECGEKTVRKRVDNINTTIKKLKLKFFHFIYYTLKETGFPTCYLYSILDILIGNGWHFNKLCRLENESVPN